MNYTQFHGNTFLFINKNAENSPFLQESKKVDLIMYYKEIEKPSNDTRKQYRCDFFNKDGSEASLCGNALLRLMEMEGVGHYVFHTISGLYQGWSNESEMGLLMKKTKIIQKNNWEGMATIYQMKCGNKHEIHLINKAFEKTIYSRCLPNNSKVFNKHFATQINENTFKVRCFEKGVGETQACGSGAYAVGIAMIKHFKLSEVNIIMKGGKYLVKEGFLIVKKNET